MMSDLVPSGFPPSECPVGQAEVAGLATHYHEINSTCAKSDDQIAAWQKSITDHGYLDEEQCESFGNWKYGPSLANKIKRNTPESQKKAFSESFNKHHPIAAARPLLSLHGFGVIVATAALHLFHPDDFPMLDDHVLLALGVDLKSDAYAKQKDSEDFMLALFDAYTPVFRRWCEELSVNPRDLDRAIWLRGKDLRQA